MSGTREAHRPRAWKGVVSVDGGLLPRKLEMAQSEASCKSNEHGRPLAFRVTNADSSEQAIASTKGISHPTSPRLGPPSES